MKSAAVRAATRADAAAVAALSKTRPFTAAWSVSALAEEAARPDCVFLIAGGVEPRGYALARVPDAEARLLDFAAAEDGAGIGRALWSALLRGVKARGAARLTLEVSEKNARALAFYTMAGAEVVGRREKFYDDGSAACLMDMTLA
jgi:ribosomal-protein-alanine N-acetyltransferase